MYDNLGRLNAALGLALLGISTSAIAVPPPQWQMSLDPKKGAIELRADAQDLQRHFTGKGAAPRGRFTISGIDVSGTALLDLETLKPLRKMNTDPEQFRDARLTLTRMQLPQDISQKKVQLGEVPFTGLLSIHGIERPVSGSAVMAKDETAMLFEARFNVKLSDYAITSPRIAGVDVADSVQVTLKDKAVLQGPAHPSAF